ncbi:MAG: hypothetical protein Q9165_000684 [Trypethelium subeluteriae]
MPPGLSLFNALLTLLVLAVPLLTLRLLAILPSRRSSPQPRTRGSPTCLLIVLGSGGHTAEMLAMLRKVDLRDYTTRVWIVGEGDDFSVAQARDFEGQLAKSLSSGVEKGSASSIQIDGGKASTITSKQPKRVGDYEIKTVPRARQIHQPLLTTPLSSLRTLLTCFPLLLYPSPPDLILTNGPATATILIFASLLLRFFDIRGCHSKGKMRTIYVESWARVKRLSLSGRLLEGVVDRFVVQWEGLEGGKTRGRWGLGRGEFRGVLV